MSGCAKRTPTDAQGKVEYYTVSKQPYAETLRFSGRISPAKVHSIFAPIAGTISEKNFIPGHTVEKDQLLYKIDIESSERALQSALTEYLTAKNAYNNAEKEKQSQDLLYTSEIISEETYRQSQQTYYATMLTYMLARQTLEQQIQTVSRTESIADTLEGIDNIDISEMDKVRQAITKIRGLNSVEVEAPESGVMLGKRDGDKDSLGVGDEVKAGQFLAKIGTIDDISVIVEVDQHAIVKLHIGQKVQISTRLLPDTVIDGEIASMSFVAKDSEDDTGNFDVVVKTPSLGEKIKQKIRFGMGVTVKTDVEAAPQMMIPLNALIVRKRKTTVKLVMPNGRLKEVPVETGDTAQGMVVVLSGLSVGDRIAVSKR